MKRIALAVSNGRDDVNRPLANVAPPPHLAALPRKPSAKTNFTLYLLLGPRVLLLLIYYAQIGQLNESRE